MVAKPDGGGGIGGGAAARARWKALVPALYDWLANHPTVWPSLSCRWGAVVEEHTFKRRQRLFVSEQTDGSAPNTLVVASADVVRPRVAAAEHIAHFREEHRSPFVKKHKVQVHPGEVNRIRELPGAPHVVVTHTDAPEVLLWNTDAQPPRAPEPGAPPSAPDLVLTGHADDAPFALAAASAGAASFVLSGGKDCCVALWALDDHATTLQRRPDDREGAVPAASSSPAAAVKGPRVAARGLFRGHTDTVEDVQFHPSDHTGSALSEESADQNLVVTSHGSAQQQFCSVGDDRCLLFWDAREGNDAPAVKVEKAHDEDVHCVDWSAANEHHVLTGSADSSVRLFDRRKLESGSHSAPLHIFQGHSAAVLCVQWCPDRGTAFASCAEDGLLNIWDSSKVNNSNGLAEAGKKGPGAMKQSDPGLIFQHVGHRDKVVDFHWNPHDPWTVVSVSDGEAGGGTLQIWRINDLITRPEAEVLAELEKYGQDILEDQVS
eukprot:SM000061S19211  [mRNA]  locus=s61:147949:150289:- [translate_table: standard]